MRRRFLAPFYLALGGGSGSPGLTTTRRTLLGRPFLSDEVTSAFPAFASGQRRNTASSRAGTKFDPAVRERLLHLTVPVADAIATMMASSGAAVVLLRDLAVAIPEDVHDELGSSSLKELVQMFPSRFAVAQQRDGAWTVGLRAPVSDLLRAELDAAVPTDAFVPLSEVYAGLSADARDDVRPHKSLKGVFEALSEVFVLSCRSTSVIRSPDITNDDETPSPLPMDPDAALVEAEERAAAEERLQRQQQMQASPNFFSPSVNALPKMLHLDPNNPMPSDFVPPPPPPSPIVASTAKHATLASNESVITIEQVCPYIPSFFVPAEVVLARMPGYTLEHIEALFIATKALQVVRLGPTAFLRLHGYFGRFDMHEVVTANNEFRKFEPDVEVVQRIFADALPRPGTWHPLRTVVQRAKQDELATLAYQGRYTLLYFAQLQHLYGFTADGDGAVARLSAVTHLNHPTSPCPITFNEVMQITRGVAMPVADVTANLSPEGRHQLFSMFNSLETFVAAHSPAFVMSSGVVMQTRDYQRLSLKERPVEEQLAAAYRAGDKRKIRILRRKMAVQAFPDNPLLDPKQLAKVIADQLPRNRHVPLHTLLRSLPNEIIDLLPNSYTKFFKGHTDYFNMFEWRFPNNFCVSRVGVPLPEGVLRGTYDELSLIACVIRVLQARRNSAPTTEILLHIPRGARDTLKQVYGTLPVLLSRYPDNFIMVQSNMYGRVDSMNVTLASIPAQLLDAVSDDPARQAQDEAAQSDSDVDDWVR